MKKIKVLYIINDLLPGGAQRVVLDVARSLNREQFDVHVIALRDVKNVGQGKGEDLTTRFRDFGVSFEILNWAGRLSLAQMRKLISSIRIFAPDVVHFHLPYSIIVGSIASWIARAPVRIAHEHNTHEFDPWKVRFLRALIKPLISLVICYTDIVEEALFGKSNVYMKKEDDILLTKKTKSLTIFNGIDAKIFSHLQTSLDKSSKRKEVGIKEGEIFLLATGRLISWKGHEHLIRSFALVLKERRDIQLRIVGYGPLDEELRRLVETLGLKENVRLLGLRTDAHELLVSADIFSNVYTYSAGTSVKEALGIAGLEAIASGTGTLVGYYESADKFAKDGVDCLFVDPQSEEDLKKAICRLAIDKELRENLGKNGMKNMQETFDWENIARRYEQVYTFLCK